MSLVAHSMEELPARCLAHLLSGIYAYAYMYIYVYIYMAHSLGGLTACSLMQLLSGIYFDTYMYIHVYMYTYIYLFRVAHSMRGSTAHSLVQLLSGICFYVYMYPPKNGKIKSLLATNRWYVVQCISQKQNESKNKKRWYNMLVNLILKFNWSLY